MAYASICGKAVANVNSPVAFATCDRCASVYNHNQLRWQYDYRGRTLQNLRILVCERCEDEGQPQLKPRILPPDPVSIANARPYPYCYAEEDDRFTTNPALPNVDLGTTANITLAGFQFVDGVQCVGGELVLVKNQTDATKNGIYKVSSGLWVLQGYNNDTKKWFSVDLNEITYYFELGYYQGAVNVARGLTQYAKLFQITFDPNGLLATGTAVTAAIVSASLVNHYDFYTGIYMEGADERITETLDVRTTQQTGAAPGSLNEIPGYSNIVPGWCLIGRPNQNPYGCGSKIGLPPGFDSLPFAGPLAPTLQNQSINYWYNDILQPYQWIGANNVTATWYPNDWWPNPGPGAPWNPIALMNQANSWINNVNLVDFWGNNLNQQVDWGNYLAQPIFPPGGEILWTNDKCELVLWHDTRQPPQPLPNPLITGVAGFNVNFGVIYPNTLPPIGLN
jgi:hypothetical protein